MRKQRQQFGGVFLNKQRGIWYCRRTINGKRDYTPIGKLSEYPTKALARLASHSLIAPPANPATPAKPAESAVEASDDIRDVNHQQSGMDSA